MLSLFHGALPRRWSCIALFALSVACEAEVASPPSPLDTQPAPLGDDAGSCAAIDDADTTCDGADDDCDGALDEDCDFGPADCPQGARVIVGDHGRNWLWGSSGRDCILGYGGDDVLVGLGGNDVLVGGAGDDMLVAGDGNDTVFGDRGGDVLLGDRGDDRLDGGEGNDLLLGGDGNDDVHGGACHDHIMAVGGSDRVFGDEGSDRVFASSAHRVDGGSGTDGCTGNGPAISCELTGERAHFCLRDDDCAAGEHCVRGALLCVREDDAAGSDATCDGYDDDCDGAHDEDFAGGTTQCGVGACAATGTSTCNDGDLEGTGTCTPGTPAASDATCDAIDDDCDGASDEQYAPVATSCGVGACAAAGATLCVSGVVASSCTPGTPAAGDATCDAIDDDCDGASDEQYAPVATSCGVGACAAAGATLCAGGTASDSCVPGPIVGDDSSCDTIDDDCDGASDEAYAAVTTYCEVAGCLAQGATACSGGIEEDQCLIHPTCIAEIACDDEIDNDGDGLVDCADVDCDGTEACVPQAFNLVTEGRTNLWGAGHASPPGGGQLPPAVALRLRGGATMRFTNVSGMIHNFEQFWEPEGIPGAHILPSARGISGYSHFSREHGMAGVFLGAGEPADPAPPRLMIPDGEFTVMRPGLNQIFYIGDGFTSTGEQQRFIVPSGARRFFLGHAHACSNGTPGCVTSLAGQYEAQGEIAFER